MKKRMGERIESWGMFACGTMLSVGEKIINYSDKRCGDVEGKKFRKKSFVPYLVKGTFNI